MLQPDLKTMLKPLPQNKSLSKTILFVDDEPMLTKWFERTFSPEFRIVCAASVDEALLIVNSANHDISVVVTDFRMPGRDGLQLLQALADSHPSVIKILASAYADKDLVLQAVNKQLVFRILEKPLDLALVRQTLKAALQFHLEQQSLRDLVENGIRGMRESLGFLAHELNAPLAIIGTYLGMLSEQTAVSAESSQAVISSAQRNIRFCQNLVNSFAQSSRASYSIAETRPVSAATLVNLLMTEFPFQGEQRQSIRLHLEADFLLPKMHNLIYLCLSTVLQNALRELAQSTPLLPMIDIALGVETPTDGQAMRKDKYWIAVADNGSGVAADVMERLLISPITTYEGRGGNGMGLMFCKKVMLSLAGNISIDTCHSDHGYKAGQTGTRVTLHFQGE